MEAIIEQTPDAVAGRAYFDQHPRALSAWRAHQWMLSQVPPEQLAEAFRIADLQISASEHELPAELEKHNRERLEIGMSEASLDDFYFLRMQAVIHVELLRIVAAGAIQ